ncbi:MAG: SH3 domain-containing protein [Patescibacteria group bacterium]|nr:SH3 domain-containing protein [Patescibacteria group bacterium]
MADEKEKLDIEDIKEPKDLDIDSAVSEESEETVLEEPKDKVSHEKTDERDDVLEEAVKESKVETDNAEIQSQEKKKKEKKEKKPKSAKNRRWLMITSIVILTALVTGAAVLGAMYYLENRNEVEEEPVTEEQVVEEPEEEEPEEESYAYISSEVGLNMRKEPNTDSEVLAIIPFGTKIPVLAEQTGWIQTEYESETGWVSADFTTTESPYIYTNNTDGFTLTMDTDWVGWKVFTKTTDWGDGIGTAKTYYFALPTTDKTWSDSNVDSGYASFFAVSILTKDQWTKVQAQEGPKPAKLDDLASGKVAVWSSGQATPSDLENRFDEIKGIIATFEAL